MKISTKNTNTGNQYVSVLTYFWIMGGVLTMRVFVLSSRGKEKIIGVETENGLAWKA